MEWNDRYFITKIHEASINLFVDYIQLKFKLVNSNIYFIQSNYKYHVYAIYKPSQGGLMIKNTHIIYKFKNTFIDKSSYKTILLNINNGLLLNNETIEWDRFYKMLIMNAYEIEYIPIKLKCYYDIKIKEFFELTEI